MLNKIIHWSIHNKLIVAVLTFIIILIGVYSLQQLPIDAVPDITNNQVQIITVSPSSGAEDIERFVTFPVEQTMASIPKIEEMRSFSRFGLSVVTIVFDENADIYWLRQQVAERLAEAKNQIPPGFGEPILAPLSTGLGEILQYTLSPKKGYESQFPASELRTIQDWTIRRQLLGVKGVADVSGFGGNVKTYEIAIDPIRLKSFGITINDVFKAVEQNNQNTGGAYIERYGMTTYIRSEGLLTNLKEIESISIKHNASSTPIFIRDVATVQFGSLVRYGALTIDDKGEAVGGIALMLKGSNSSEVIALVKEKMKEIESTLPEGVKVEYFLDRTNLVNRAVSTVSTNLLEGATIVILVLVLLLGNFRAGLIVASVIPIAMLIAITLMSIFGVSGNLMSLGALDFGLIIDGAVIIVESTLHFIHRRKEGVLVQDDMNSLVYNSASKFSKSAVFGQVIILVVYLPILALVGIEGKMFKPMALTVMFAVFGALLLSLTYVPMMTSLFLSKKVSHKINFSDRLVAYISGLYRPVLHRIIKNQKMALSTIVGLFIAAILLFNRLGAEFIPSLDEGDFAVETRLITGAGLSKTIETTTAASKILEDNFPEIKKVIGKIGTAEIPTDPMPMEAADLMIILKDKSEWVSAETKDELAEKMKLKLEENLPGVSFGFQQPIQMRFNELMTGAKQDVVVKIYGEDFSKLSQYAKQVGGIANKIKGIQDVYVEELEGLPQLIVKYDREALARYNLSIDDVNKAINTSFAGQTAGIVFEGEKRFSLIVKLDSASREGHDDLSSIAVTNDDGNQIPLSELAQIDYKIGANQIQRDDAKRRVMVGFNVRGRDVESIIEELKSKIDGKVVFLPGYHVSFGGSFKNLEHARSRLLIAVPSALLLIFFLLYLTFKSLKQALLIFTAIPLAAIGGIFALFLRGMPFSISAGVGFIALFGVAVLNGIVLLSEFNALKAKGIKSNLKIILMGTSTRFRPVLLTAMVASLGFLPMALSHGSGAEVQKPLATVVIGGLISATLLTLFILPILYLLSNLKINWRKKKNPGIAILLCLIGFQLSAQYNMDLSDCFKVAKERNYSVQINQIELLKQVNVSKSLVEIPKTTVTGMMGQYNSHFQKDNNISIAQKIPFPTIFSTGKAIGIEQQKVTEFENQASWLSLKRDIELSYDHYQYLLDNLDLLKVRDSLLTIEMEKLAVRRSLQDVTALDFSLMKSKKMSLENDLRNNLVLIEEQLIIIGNILNLKKDQFSLRDEEYLPRIILVQEDSTLFSKHPSVLAIEQRGGLLLKQKDFIKAKQLPDISLSYFNQTLVGTQQVNGLNVQYNLSDRFQGGSIGLDLPIFSAQFKAQKNVLAQELQQNELRKLDQLSYLQGNYEQIYAAYEGFKNTQLLFDEQLLPEADLLFEQNNILLKNGEISVISYLQVLDEINSIRRAALLNNNQLNRQVILINWFNNN